MKLKILVIDDYIPAAEMLALVMEMKDYEVRKAYDAASAFEVLNEFTPDVVLCDINMPDVQGYEVCATMRRDKRLKKTLFIAQTGLSPLTAGSKIMEAGFDHHVVKPIDIGVLSQIITEHFSQKSTVAGAA